MTESFPPAESADQLRRYLYPPRVLDSKSLARNAKALARALRTAEPGHADTARAAAEGTIHLRLLAGRSQNKQDAKVCLAAMLAAGRLGCLAACRFVLEKSISLSELAPMVQSLGGQARLHLTNELLRRPETQDKDILLWARDQLDEVALLPAPELVDGLAVLARRGDGLAFPVRQALLDGPLGDWLRKLCAAGGTPDLLDQAALACGLLAHAGLARGLAKLAEERPLRPGPVLLDTLAGLYGLAPQATLRALAALHAKADPAHVLACGLALAQVRHPQAWKALRMATQKHKELVPDACRCAALLPEDQLAPFVDSFPKPRRGQVLALVLEGAARADPDLAEVCRRQALDLEGLEADVRKDLNALLAGQHAAHPAGLEQRTLPPPPAAPAKGQEKKGLLSRLTTAKKQDLASVLDTTPNPKDLSLPGSSLAEADYSARSLHGVDLTGSRFHQVRFQRFNFSGVVLADSGLAACEFTDCTFKNANLAGATLHNTVFRGCTFAGCDLSNLTMVDCALEDCRLDSCLLSGGLLHGLALTRTRAAFLSLAGSRLQSCMLLSSELAACDLSGAELLACTAQGTVLRDCALEGTILSESVFSQCLLDGCNLVRCEQRRNAAPLAPLEEQRLASIRKRLRDSTSGSIGNKNGDPPTALATGQGPTLARRSLAIWLRRLEMGRRNARMLANNQRRMAMSERRMAGRDFFKLLPWLLVTDLFEQQARLPFAQPASLLGYHPDPETLALAAEHFPGLVPSKPQGRPLAIQALYAMGSVGSIAQTPASDVDYWVCYDGQDADPDQVRHLRKKLDGLCELAMERFGLEAYFFTMALEDVRNNDFGFSDKESSGSAQARLLKDEFYRSALLVAGQAPLWWVTPPGADQATYEAYRDAARDFPQSGSPWLVDLGRPAPVSPEEFFGAALWQIVKALYNPYKSVLKLGLLEKYAGASGQWTLLLCDRLKHNLLRGCTDVSEVDPYGLLFRELRATYNAADNKDAVRLLLESLLIKAQPADYDFTFSTPAWHEETSFLSYLLGQGKARPEFAQGLRREWSFERSMKLGATVRRFLTGAYKRIQTERRQGALKAAITPEDMTRLGRQVAVNYAAKQHKVSRVPFLEIGRGRFAELYFAAQKTPGKQPAWMALGKGADEAKLAAKDMPLLYKHTDPVALLAWLVANRLYSPGGLVHGDRSIAPLSVVDMNNILAGLHEFLAQAGLDRIEPQAYLDSEMVTRAFFIFNLTEPQDNKKVAQASVVYATNWGEVFCRTFHNPGPKLLKQASAFLREQLDQDVSNPLEMKAYYPKRSQCARVTLV